MPKFILLLALIVPFNVFAMQDNEHFVRQCASVSASLRMIKTEQTTQTCSNILQQTILSIDMARQLLLNNAVHVANMGIVNAKSMLKTAIDNHCKKHKTIEKNHRILADLHKKLVYA